MQVVTAWRIVKTKYAKNAFSGEGSRRTGGRWTRPGLPAVYVAEHESLAVLEMLTHVDDQDLLTRYSLIRITIPAAIIGRVEVDSLPKNWRKSPPPKRLKEIGDAWFLGGKHAVLRVPSAVSTSDGHFILNPNHPDFARITFGAATVYRIDPRL